MRLITAECTVFRQTVDAVEHAVDAHAHHRFSRFGSMWMSLARCSNA